MRIKEALKLMSAAILHTPARLDVGRYLREWNWFGLFLFE